MVISITSGLVKIAVTYLFVRVIPLSVMGVSVANIVAWSVFLGMGLWSLTQKSSTVKLRIKHIRFYKDELKPILRVGVPSALQMGMYSVANVIIASAVNSFGTAASTGVSIANNFDGILYNICHATSLAVLPYVSQNIGAGNPRRAAQSVWKGVLVTVCIGAFFGAMSAIFSAQLSSVMSDDPEVIAWSCQKMIIISSTYFICGINDIFGAALRGMGKPMVATVSTLVYMCLFRFVWVYLIFPLLPNLTFLYLVWPIGWILSIITLLFIFFPTTKKLKQETLAANT
jgi:Na+-driven multidrug efflux pump